MFAVKRRLADVLFLKKLLLALELFAGHLHAGAGCIHLRHAGGGTLRSRPGINTHQLLPGLDRIAHFRVECNDGALHLG